MEERGAILHAVREALRPDGTPTEWAMVADGPVKLLREAEGWKVVDMMVEGRSLQAAFFAADQRATVGGLDVTVLGGRTTANQLLFFVELVNRAGRAVELRAAAAGNRRPSLFGEGIREDAPRSLERLVATHMRHENCRGPG
jgi:hypothetical protein